MRGRSDVLVVGAGPAGSAAAIELARAGARVALVDRARFPRPKTCGDALSNGALRIADELGVDLSRAGAAAVRSSTAVFPGGHRITRRYAEAPGAILPRRELDSLLRERALALGAEPLEAISVRSLERSARGVEARGEGFVWSSDAVVAADGPASVAWSALGRRAPRGAALAVASTAYYEGVELGDESESEHYFERDLASGYGWIFPAAGGLCNIGIYQRADRYRQSGRHLHALLDEFIARHPERFARARRVGQVRSWPLPLAGLRSFAGAPGILACGDAARLIDPLTGEGIWHALHSGRLAARAVLEGLAHHGVDRAALRRFARASATEVAWPAASRRVIQDGIDVVLRTGLFRSRAVRAALDWGFRRGTLEVSKSVDG